MNEKKKKKEEPQSVTCPLCQKESVLNKELESWHPSQYEELQKVVQEKFVPLLKTMVELLNHDKLVGGNITKRTALLSTIIEFLLENTLTTNYHRIGLLEFSKQKVIKTAEIISYVKATKNLNEMTPEQLQELGIEKKNKRQNKYVI